MLRALWKIDVHLISILVNKSIYYIIIIIITRALYSVVKHDSLIHLFHKTTVRVMNARVSGQRLYTISIYSINRLILKLMYVIRGACCRNKGV